MWKIHRLSLYMNEKGEIPSRTLYQIGSPPSTHPHLVRVRQVVSSGSHGGPGERASKINDDARHGVARHEGQADVGWRVR